MERQISEWKRKGLNLTLMKAAKRFKNEIVPPITTVLSLYSNTITPPSIIDSCQAKLVSLSHTSPLCCTRMLSHHSAVCRTTALVLITTEREGGLALRLGHFAGQVDKGFDECAPVHHRQLPQTHLLVLCPVLGHVRVNSPLILPVQLVPQHHDGHL